MTLSSSMAILLCRSMGVRDKLVMQDLLDVGNNEEMFKLVVDIVRYTFFIELWGGIILTTAFTLEGFEFSQALYLGFFHSISAFCNAGFSLFSNSFESFSTNWLINFTISALVILGGVGFIVMRELKFAIMERRSWVRFTLHTKIVLVTSGILLLLGSLIIFFGEFLYGLDKYSLFDKMQISFFQSMTTRTAGFNSVPMESLQSHTLYVLTLFMFIGGASGSTAGGIKVTTFAILVQSIRATLKGRALVEIFGRQIPSILIVKVTAVTMISLFLATFSIYTLMRLEPDLNFLQIYFESVSALGTVGLSLGITSQLAPMSKFIVILMMLVGRIGPLTLVLAIASRQGQAGSFQYPEGKVMIG